MRTHVFSFGMFRGNWAKRAGALLLLRLLALPLFSLASVKTLWPVPAAVASSHFVVTIDGQTTPVMHAAEHLYFLNFEARPKHRLKISVTADRDDFWARGVEVQPWRLGIRPQRDGRTLRFELDGPVKLTISRPGDFLGEAEMLFLFANAPEQDAPSGPAPGLRYFGPGVHRENIDAVSGEQIYLAPGAVLFGALNIWGVDRVRVWGRGTIVYDGPQNPADDDGWMHKRNWHCIVMDQAHEISIEGITCVVRSRTWQIQMKSSHGVVFDNVKVIGANAGNANADGMDWLGGGDAVVRDSFLRAADDVFAMQGSWEGYGAKAFAVEGEPVTNVTVEDSVVSTSISNIVRAGWPEKNFEGGGFTMRNMDVLHMGLGGCGIPFALMEIWADPNGRGRSAGYRFEDVRMEDWTSLVQLMEPAGANNGISGLQLRDVVGLETPSLVPSVLSGAVRATSLDGVRLGGNVASSDGAVPIELRAGVEAPQYAQGGPMVEIRHDEGLLRPGKKVYFEAVATTGDVGKKWQYAWSFGDGKRASGRKVKHGFPDTAGTLWDGSGRFRVLLQVIDRTTGRRTWIYAPVVVTDDLSPALTVTATQPGLNFRYVESEQPMLGQLATSGEATGDEMASGVSGAGFALEGVRRRPERYGLAFTGYVDAPVDGGYMLALKGTDAGRLRVDGRTLAELPATPFAQVCGLAGNAVRWSTGAVALSRGLHRIEVEETHGAGLDGFGVLWRVPGSSAMVAMPSTVLTHAASVP